MKLLLIDGLNFLMHRFPQQWSTSFQVIKHELNSLAAACAADDVLPLIVLDLYKSGDVGLMKWRRRQKKLLMRNRGVPCSASCLIGTILAETDMAWTYATEMEADDLIIEIAKSVTGCVVLSGDKGYLRTQGRNFCVARTCSYSNGLRLLHVTHAQTCRCSDNISIPPLLHLAQNVSKIDFYISEIRREQTIRKGVFYTGFSVLPCMWCFLRPLREDLYSYIGVQKVPELHVCADMCRQVGRLYWSSSDVYPSINQDPCFTKTCYDKVKEFKNISRQHAHLAEFDHENAVFACAVSVAQILTDIWYVNRGSWIIVDTLSASRMFNFHVKLLLKPSYEGTENTGKATT